jgi:hypothetical protein
MKLAIIVWIIDLLESTAIARALALKNGYKLNVTQVRGAGFGCGCMEGLTAQNSPAGCLQPAYRVSLRMQGHLGAVSWLTCPHPPPRCITPPHTHLPNLLCCGAGDCGPGHCQLCRRAHQLLLHHWLLLLLGRQQRLWQVACLWCHWSACRCGCLLAASWRALCCNVLGPGQTQQGGGGRQCSGGFALAPWQLCAGVGQMQ